MAVDPSQRGPVELDHRDDASFSEEALDQHAPDAAAAPRHDIGAAHPQATGPEVEARPSTAAIAIARSYAALR
jgi:hypothetical protein